MPISYIALIQLPETKPSKVVQNKIKILAAWYFTSK